jgi:hypothetical protein
LEMPNKERQHAGGGGDEAAGGGEQPAPEPQNLIGNEVDSMTDLRDEQEDEVCKESSAGEYEELDGVDINKGEVCKESSAGEYEMLDGVKKNEGDAAHMPRRVRWHLQVDSDGEDVEEDMGGTSKNAEGKILGMEAAASGASTISPIGGTLDSAGGSYPGVEAAAGNNEQAEDEVPLGPLRGYIEAIFKGRGGAGGDIIVVYANLPAEEAYRVEEENGKLKVVLNQCHQSIKDMAKAAVSPEL